MQSCPPGACADRAAEPHSHPTQPARASPAPGLARGQQAGPGTHPSEINLQKLHRTFGRAWSMGEASTGTQASCLSAAHPMGPNRWVRKSLLLPVKHKRDGKNSAGLISSIPAALWAYNTQHNGGLISAGKRDERQDIFCLGQ